MLCNQLSGVKNNFGVQQPQTTGLALPAQIYSNSGLFTRNEGMCTSKLKKNPSVTLAMVIVKIKAMSPAATGLSSVRQVADLKFIFMLF